MRKIIALLLAALLIFGIFTPALAVEYDTEEVYLQSSLPFTDVRSNQWFYPYVRTMHQNGVMTGTTATTFAPQGTFTRAQVLATLFRIHHGRASNANDSRNSGFSDVTIGNWFAPYATWARNNSIATGATLGGNTNAQRQEIALFIHNYVRNLTDFNSGSTANAQWNALVDRGQIGSANYNALRWANNHGIVRGITNDGVTRIVPQGTATRAEAATMLVRLMNLLPNRPPATSLTSAVVSRVIDGDTLELETGERVRLIGVDAPEIGEPSAAAATRFVRDLVEGRTIWLEADGNNTDAFGRLRRYVWLQVPTDVNNEQQIRAHMLNAMLLENGHATVMIVGNVRHEALFRRIAPTPPQPPTPPTGNFIGNVNTQVFHVPTCSTLPAPQNRIYFQTRQDAINAGHRPCSRCNP